MKTKNYYAIQVELENGKKLLSWESKGYFYFSLDKSCPTPKLFNKKSEAKEALLKRRIKGGNLSQFRKVIEPKSFKIVKISIKLK